MRACRAARLPLSDQFRTSSTAYRTMAAQSSALDVPSGGSSFGLFTNQIIKFVILGLGCVFSVMIGIQVTDSDANGVSIFMRYVAAATFIMAMISPKAGIYMVLFMCPVLDVIKRTLILFDAVNMFDVASVLAVAPVTMAGAVLGTFGSRIVFRSKAAIPGERTLFLIMMAVVSLIVLSGFLHNEDSKLSLLRDLAEACIYLCLILLIPVYFPATTDIAALLRACVVVFIPVALYGFWQLAFGLSNFEERYLLSGLTVTTGDYLSSGRVFSTLNSNHSFSVTMACCAIISLLQRQLPYEDKWQKLVKKYGWWLFALFCAATIISLRRTGWLVVGFSLLGAFAYRSPTRTIIFYVLCLAGGLLLIFNAETIYGKLPIWESSLQAALPGTDDRALVLQTFNDRLYSFENLRDNRAIWSFFGLAVEERESIFAHDAITQSIVSYGVVGVTAFVTVIVTILTMSHRLVWRATNEQDQRYASLLLGFVFSNLFVGALMQSHIDIFPVNFIFWMCAGALLKITFQQQPIVLVKPKVDLAALAEALRIKRPTPNPMGTYTLPGR